MSLTSSFKLLQTPKICLHQIRTTIFMKKKIFPTVYPSLQERLKEFDLEYNDPEVYSPVNIGFARKKLYSRKLVKERLSYIKENLKSPLMQKLSRERKLQVDLTNIEDDWKNSDWSLQIQELAKHCGIFQDLFGLAYFCPCIDLSVTYPYKEDEVSPVYWGNTIKPSEAVSEPAVSFNCDPDTLWTLILTNPDGNLYENDSECLHWFVGNIKGSDLSSGEVVMDYMRPFPPKGTGYHRLIFILYKQDKHIDYSNMKVDLPCTLLKRRTFGNKDFYKAYQEYITPAGIAWFQSDWDSSLKDFYHNILKMREPVFEYEFPEPYIAPVKHFPRRQFFNRYLDRYRDKKELAEDILLKRLKMIHPFKKEPLPLPFPNAVTLDYNLPSWQRQDMIRERQGIGKYRDLYSDSTRPPYMARKKKYVYT